MVSRETILLQYGDLLSSGWLIGWGGGLTKKMSFLTISISFRLAYRGNGLLPSSNHAPLPFCPVVTDAIPQPSSPAPMATPRTPPPVHSGADSSCLSSRVDRPVWAALVPVLAHLRAGLVGALAKVAAVVEAPLLFPARAARPMLPVHEGGSALRIELANMQAVG